MNSSLNSAMWTIADTTKFYNLESWGNQYFCINNEGQLCAKILSDSGNEITLPLQKVADKAQREGYSLPVLVRFKSILRDRLRLIGSAFQQARQTNAYQADYTCVYPIKVNQQHSVVAELAAQSQHALGFEAGSKAELLAIIGLEQKKARLIICNGYKDDDYIRLALIGQQLGKRTILVIEKLSELKRIFRIADTMNITPEFGIRVRMYSVNKGKWQDTGGERAKFGLSPSQLITAINYLREVDQLSGFKLLHCHLGSQIPELKEIKDGISECGRHYAELSRLGVDIEFLDLGGGLGVDYDGTNSNEFNSINYSLEQYADTIVENLSEICSEYQIKHPHIITESGRALTAHHALMITDVVDVESAPGLKPAREPNAREHIVVSRLWSLEIESGQSVDEYEGIWQELRDLLKFAHTAYTLKELSINEWAHCEQLYFVKCRELLSEVEQLENASNLTLQLRLKVADKVFCNFSLFQSLPDAWGVDQLFPILPLSNLNKQPTHAGLIKDITCDSDGRIDQYVSDSEVSPILMLAKMDSDNYPLIGVFMMGAYQEILGDMHNLFGDPDAIAVDVNATGDISIQQETDGDRIDELLDYVHFDQKIINRNYRELLSQIEDKTRRDSYLQTIRAALSGSTYLTMSQ